MCNKAVNTNPSTIHLVPECYKTHAMRLNKYVTKLLIFVFFGFDSIPNRYKIQEISGNLKIIKICELEYLQILFNLFKKFN